MVGNLVCVCPPSVYIPGGGCPGRVEVIQGRGVCPGREWVVLGEGGLS